MSFFRTVTMSLFSISFVSLLYYTAIVRPRMGKKPRPSVLRSLLELEKQTTNVSTVFIAQVLPTPPEPLVCFVVTFKQPKIQDPLRSLAHKNTAKMYKGLEPAIVSFLAIGSTSPSESESIWKDAGNTHILRNIQTNEHGTPFFRALMERVERRCPKSTPFVAYANADIMFDTGLVQTLEGLKAWGGAKILTVGQRRNHDLTGPLSSIAHIPSELFVDVAQDYFIMSRKLFGDWSTLPPYVIGRRAYDNALVDWAFHNANLVDATATVIALHQTTKDGNYAGHDAVNIDKEYNVNLPGAVYDHGSTRHAKFTTKRCGIERVCVYNMTNQIQPANWVPPLDNALTDGTATSGKLFQMKKRIKPAISSFSALRTTALKPTKYPVGRRWAVVTTIFHPTAVIKTLAFAKNWCTVVVCDSKSVPESEYMAAIGGQPGCFVYLTVKKQLQLDYNIIPLIGMNTFGRKNIGFIFAMHHGADVIYDTDDDNEIHDLPLLNYWTEDNAAHSWPWVATGSNPYPAFGVPNIWPRGLPLDSIKVLESNAAEPGLSTEACIIQSLANEEPDVDAIYRLTNPNYPVNFNGARKASYVKAGSIAPFNAQATLFTRKGFELMLLPVTVHGRVSDIWRGYVAQAVSSNCRLVFSSPWATQKRNAHNYLADFDSELPLYTQASELVWYLEDQAYPNVSEAMHDMFEHDIVKKDDVLLAHAWSSDVVRAMKTPRQPVPKFRHLFISMGKTHQLQFWMHQIMSDTSIDHVDMVLGSFDQQMECLASARVECHFVAGTTWTTGRNALVKKAFERERKHNITYDYWTISDADTVLACRLVFEGELAEHPSCFAVYDTFLQQVDTPVAALHGEIHMSTNINPLNTMARQEAFDAQWNTVHRDAVAIMFPYYADLDAVTWWSSQAIFWYRLQCFAPNFAAVPVSVFCRNPDHNPYPRDPRNHEAEKAVATSHFYELSGQLPPAPIEYEGQILHERIRSISSMATDKDWRQEPLFLKCAAAFSNRFVQWVESP